MYFISDSFREDYFIHSIHTNFTSHSIQLIIKLNYFKKAILTIGRNVQSSIQAYLNR